jgi:hypothetical protein
MAQTIIEVQRTDGINAGFYLNFSFLFFSNIKSTILVKIME